MGPGALLLLALALPAHAADLPQSDWERWSLLTPAGPDRPSSDTVRRLEPLVFTEHRVGLTGRSVEAVARAYGTDVASLQSANGEDIVLLPPGRGLRVFNKRGMLYEVRPGPDGQGELLDDVVSGINRDRQTAEKLKERIVLANDLPGTALLYPFRLQAGRVLWVPGAAAFSDDTFRFPFRREDLGLNRVSSVFGTRQHPVLETARFHKGLDFPKPYGTPVYPAKSGRVARAGWVEGLGWAVFVLHTDGTETRYGHLGRLQVKPGQWVVRDQTVLGKVGSSGLATGPHLHFEARDREGNPVDPRLLIGH